MRLVIIIGIGIIVGIILGIMAIKRNSWFWIFLPWLIGYIQATIVSLI